MPIKVLLVDDSATTRRLLSYLIDEAPDMEVIGEAINGAQAVEMVEKLRPDVVLMDVMMPLMDGLEATRVIMDVKPTPVVIMSANLDSRETNVAFEAVTAGALAVLKKPGMTQTLSYQDSVKEFLKTLRSMASVRVIRHTRSARASAVNQANSQVHRTPELQIRPEIISIASSTGGPQTLSEIIKKLPSTFSLPIVIVQHISADFVTPMVDWFSTVSQMPVRIANPGERPQAGTVYFAPGSKHLQLTSDRRFELSDTPANVPHIPSGDVLLKSVAQRYGSRAVGIVLTGMGRDGADGLRAMYDAGAMTVAQDEASCIVFGMPQEAIALGAARQTLPPSEISKLLLQYNA